MSDWQKGDLALCIDDGPVRQFANSTECAEKYNIGLKKGRIYTVEYTQMSRHNLGLGLMMVEGCGGYADRFRKIRPSAIKHIEALKDIPLPVRENEHA